MEHPMSNENNSSAPLLPCPFCGAAARMKPSTRGDYTSIVCNSPCAGPLAIVVPNDQIEAGIAAWNTRAPQAVEAQAPAAVAVPDEREVFEAFMRNDTSGFSLEREGETYKEFEVATYWHFWRARAALAATPALPATEDSSAGDQAEATARQAAPNGWREPIQTVKYWRDAYSNPQGDEHFMGHGMVVKIMEDQLAMLSATPPPPEREPLTDEQIDDLCGEANRGFDIERDHYLKAFRDAERAHGIGATVKNLQASLGATK